MKNSLCSCGHDKADHFHREGSCNKCGCTWYHPGETSVENVFPLNPTTSANTLPTSLMVLVK